MSTDLICKAISQRKCITFNYKNALRRVEPHLLGYNTKNNLTLSAWQLGSGGGEGWRAFHVDLLTNLSVSDDNFSQARPGYNPNDETMIRIVCRI
jgi:predicted DNA-binding transcriptional regulator YafY